MGRKFGYLFLCVFVWGCFPAGRDFPTAPIRDIQANTTTRTQIFGAFGEPMEQGMETGGYETWTYYYVIYGLGGVQTRKQLQVTFNKDGTVRTYSFTAK